MLDYYKMTRTLLSLGAYASYNTGLIVVRPKTARKVFAVKETDDKGFALCVQEGDEYVPLVVLNGQAGLVRVHFPCAAIFSTFEEALDVGLTVVGTSDVEQQQIKDALKC